MINFYRIPKIFLTALLAVFALIVFREGNAQRYEAENATLTGGAAKKNSSNTSGGAYVALGEGNITFNISLQKTGYYNIAIKKAGSNGAKTNYLEVNGSSLAFFTPGNADFTLFQLIAGLKLEKGNNSLIIKKSWGWIDIDYIELQEVTASGRFNINTELVTPNPLPEAHLLYRFLYDNYGEKIISGVQTLHSMDEINWLKENTGKEPALIGLDFMHCGRNYSWYNDKEPINDAKAYYEKNGIPIFAWHWRDPSRKTEEFYPKTGSRPNGTEFDISKVFEPDSEEYQAMIADIDYISGLLKELQDENVPVLWRPLHEAAGGWFWWGTKGPEPCKALYRLMYDRMVNHHGLRNLIWIWTREPQDDQGWYPGDEYVDIIGRDIYRQGDHGSQELEFYAMNAVYGGKKMLTLSEVGSFPDPDNLQKDGVGWSWFMPWYGEYTRDAKHNPLALWQKTMTHDYVLTLDKMPDLRNYEPLPVKPVVTGSPQNEKKKKFRSSLQ